MDTATPPSQRKYWIFAALFTFSLGADQLTKVWARASLKSLREPMTVVEGFFDFVYSENPGSAFGLFRNLPGGRWLLLVVGIGAMFVVASLLRRSKAESWRIHAELGLLAGGALGNIIDRVWQGVVTDFVLWHWHDHHWPVFNVADAALVVGVIGLLIDLRGDEQPAKAAATIDDAPRARKRAT